MRKEQQLGPDRGEEEKRQASLLRACSPSSPFSVRDAWWYIRARRWWRRRKVSSVATFSLLSPPSGASSQSPNTSIGEPQCGRLALAVKTPLDCSSIGLLLSIPPKGGFPLPCSGKRNPDLVQKRWLFPFHKHALPFSTHVRYECPVRS